MVIVVVVVVIVVKSINHSCYITLLQYMSPAWVVTNPSSFKFFIIPDGIYFVHSLLSSIYTRRFYFSESELQKKFKNTFQKRRIPFLYKSKKKSLIIGGIISDREE